MTIQDHAGRHAIGVAGPGNMRASQLKEKKKKTKARHHVLGGFPVVTLMVGHGDDGGIEENNQAAIAKKGIRVGSLVDLTKQFPSYKSLIGQIKEITEFGKVKIQIVQLEAGSKPAQHKIGTMISVAPNYISKDKIVNEFAPHGGNNALFVMHPDPALRATEKIKLSDVEDEETFRVYWNQLTPIYHEIFDHKIPILKGRDLPARTRLTDFKGYFYLVTSEIAKLLKQRASDSLKKMKFNESSAELKTASALAQELYQNLDDLEHIKASGSTIAAGNPHNVRSLTYDIVQLYKEIIKLGFDYNPNSPNLVSPRRTTGPDSELEEEIKLNAPHKKLDRKELQSYLDRVKTGTKTKKDKFAPIVHGSNIKAITKSDDPDDRWDLDDLANQITTRPRALLGTNAKMEKSKTEGEIIYDLTLPALSGIVVDEGTGDFVEITTCPGAGECQLFCYARKGGYIMFPASSMSAAQALNFLVNDPKGYSDMVNREIRAIKVKTDKAGIQLVVRWHDAGDFFSKEYLDLAFDVARSNPDVQFYAYTKMGDVATANTPNNFIINFSSGSKRREEKKIEIHRAKTQQEVKAGVTVPKDMFFDLIAREGNKLIKDAKGRTQFKSPEALEMFKDRLAAAYKVNPDTIITYDQMLDTPISSKPHWNVIVQPGAGDRAANRRDVVNSFLMFH